MLPSRSETKAICPRAEAGGLVGTAAVSVEAGVAPASGVADAAAGSVAPGAAGCVAVAAGAVPGAAVGVSAEGSGEVGEGTDVGGSVVVPGAGADGSGVVGKPVTVGRAPACKVARVFAASSVAFALGVALGLPQATATLPTSRQISKRDSLFLTLSISSHLAAFAADSKPVRALSVPFHEGTKKMLL